MVVGERGKTGRGTFVLAIALFAAAMWPRAAQAAEQEPEPSRHFGGQRTFGLGPAVGLYAGFGAVVVLDLEPVGAVVSGGYLPLFIFGNEDFSNDFDARYFGSAELNADLLIGPLYRGRKMEIDLLAGYRFNTVLGHGGGLGLRFALDVSRLVRLEFSWTPNVFPEAEDRLAEEGYPDDVEASLPWWQGGLGAAAVFYP